MWAVEEPDILCTDSNADRPLAPPGYLLQVEGGVHRTEDNSDVGEQREGADAGQRSSGGRGH